MPFPGTATKSNLRTLDRAARAESRAFEPRRPPAFVGFEAEQRSVIWATPGAAVRRRHRR